MSSPSKTTASAWKRWSIRWGVHPDSRKRPAADRPIETLPLPRHLYLPLQQHVGAPASPVVVIGQHVRKGELIAESQGNISAPVHASTSGKVTAIVDVPYPHPSGLASLAIHLEADGKDEWVETKGCDDPFALAPEEVARRVAAAGVVGLGGATFPSAVKLALGRRVAVSTLIVNGGECEPYLSCDDRLMREYAHAVVDGMRIIRHAIGADAILCGIEDNKPEAIAAMREAAAGFAEVKIVPVPSRYPMGSDKQLINTLTGKEVPADGRAADVGVLVHNVGTAYAVHNALRHGRPLVTRVVTVNGGAVAEPRNLLVPIGTMVSELFAFCGGFAETPARIVMGGPMMGTPLPNAQVPLIKGTSGILALTRAEVERDKPAPCIRCGSCVTACPQNLLPMEMAAFIRAGELEGAVDWGLKDCIHCGSCAYVCPAHIPLVQYFDYAKGDLAARERAKLKQDATRQLTEQRGIRLEREAIEKAEAAARRKAERAKAKAAAAAVAQAAQPSEAEA
jgi:Na+-translocating ferredoxin:NAD+ oxidoreductase subunit C